MAEITIPLVGEFTEEELAIATDIAIRAVKGALEEAGLVGLVADPDEEETTEK